MLTKDLSIDEKLIANSTYEYLPNTKKKKEVLIHSHSKFVLRNFQQNVNEENQCLP